MKKEQTTDARPLPRPSDVRVFEIPFLKPLARFKLGAQLLAHFDKRQRKLAKCARKLTGAGWHMEATFTGLKFVWSDDAVAMDRRKIKRRVKAFGLGKVSWQPGPTFAEWGALLKDVGGRLVHDHIKQDAISHLNAEGTLTDQQKAELASLTVLLKDMQAEDGEAPPEPVLSEFDRGVMYGRLDVLMWLLGKPHGSLQSQAEPPDDGTLADTDEPDNGLEGG